MEKLLFLLLIIAAGCEKSSQKVPTVSKIHRILVHTNYDAQSYVTKIVYNGTLITLTPMIGYPEVVYDSLETVAGATVDVYVSGGGNKNDIQISDWTSAYPVHEAGGYIPAGADNLKYTLTNAGATDIDILIEKTY